MKHIFLILLLIMAIKTHAQQNCSDVVKPTNLSPFDWKQTQYSKIYVAPVNDIGPANEIFPQYPFDYPRSDANIDNFREDNPKDFSENEGWVLIKANFGTSGVAQNGVTTPSFVLYNKYQSKLRVFFFLPRSLVNNQLFTKAIITLGFKTELPYAKESALLSSIKMPQKALDAFEKKQTATVVNAYENGGNYWLFGDFPVTYDPCTCNHKTAIRIQPTLIDIKDLQVSFTPSKSDAKSIVENNNLGAEFWLNTIGNFVNVLNGAFTSGSKSFKKFDDIKGVTNFLNVVTQASGNPNSTAPKGTATTTATGTGTTPITGKPIIPKYADIPSNFDKSVVAIPSWLKLLPNVGAAFGILDYFLSAGGSATATPSGLTYTGATGTIQTTSPFQAIEFYTPGSDLNSRGSNTLTPHYDNTLGLVSVLNTPVADKSTEDLSTTNPYDRSGLRVRYKLRPNQIQYAINPSAEVDVVSVQGALVLTSTVGTDVGAADFFSFTKTVNDNFINSPYQPTGRSLPIEENLFAENMLITKDKKTFRYESSYMSLDCLENYVLSLAQSGGARFTVKLKFILKRRDNPIAKEIVYLFNQDVNVVTSSLIGITDISKIPSVVRVENISLGKDLTIQAWDKIIMGSNIQTNGFKLNLITGGSVDINPTVLNPNITISIKAVADCGNQVRLPVASTVLSSFCSSKYNPVVPPPLVPRDDANSLKIQRPITASLSVSPNPFNNVLSIQYELQEPTQVTVSLSNALGQVVKVLVNEKVEAGNYQINESTADLPTGVYIVSMKTPMGMKTQKVVKQGN